MNNLLGIIKTQLYDYSELLHKKTDMSTIEYKCENWEEANNTSFEKELMDLRVQVVKNMNDFIKYPETKLLFINTTKKIKIKKGDFGLNDIQIEVPFINKREYYCLMKLLDESKDILMKWNKDTYIFK